MGAYKELKKIILNFKRNNVIAYFKNRRSGIIIYYLSNSHDVIVLTFSDKHKLMSSITICMDEFIKDRDEIKSDERIELSVRKEFLEFCDEHYNLINNLYGRDF